MKTVWAILTLSVGALALTAAELGSIKRAIAKEPVYQSKSPRYCLLVFGRDAQTRIWLVVDGEDLYADRNGNGDLTEKGEKKRAITWGAKDGTLFEFGGITTIDGKKVHLALTHRPKCDQADHLSISVEGRALQYASSDDQGSLKFAGKPQDAPIVHFNGPLTMRPFENQSLALGAQVQDFSIMIGTPGLGSGTFASLSCDQVPKNLHPIAEFEFPPLRPLGNSLKVTVRLDQRC